MDNCKKIAVITGATGGLGKAFARHLAAAGYNLLLSGRSSYKLHLLADEMSTVYGVEVQAIAADLSHRSGIDKLVDSISTLPRIDMLVSNAGYGERAMFEDEHISDALDMIRVHIDATVQLVHAVLPHMRRQRAGDIIAVSSLSAYVPAPGSSIYASTKTFINTFMESIQMEVHSYGISVQSLCPGLTHTGFHDGAVEKNTMNAGGINMWMDADDVVAASLRGLKKGSVVYIPGMKNRLLKFLIGLLPRSCYFIISQKMTSRVRAANPHTVVHPTV